MLYEVITYLRRNKLSVQPLGRGFCWLDTGTHESLMQASNYVQAVQERQGLKIACIEEIAYQLGYIDLDQTGKVVHGHRTKDGVRRFAVGGHPHDPFSYNFV